MDAASPLAPPRTPNNLSTVPTPPDHPPITAADVQKVARLARLALAPAEVEPARAALAAVLGYVARINSVNLAGVEPLASPTEQEAQPRADEPGPHLDHAAFIGAAPASFERFIRVPRVLGGGGAGEGA